VDPQLLFDMLAAVKRFYEQDVTRAEALLDDLTAFLRVALSRLRSAQSTLELEFGLVQSYVRLLRGAERHPSSSRSGCRRNWRRPSFQPACCFPVGWREGQRAVHRARCVGAEDRPAHTRTG
jgi:hypothetical protein